MDTPIVIDAILKSDKSQIEPDNLVFELLHSWGIETISSVEELTLIHHNLHNYLKIIPYTDETKSQEAAIRWKRTGAGILKDKYVYQGKACTDYVVSFLTLVTAGGIKGSSFVKLKHEETEMVHSVAEVALNDIWYIIDVANAAAKPIPGRVEDKFGNYRLWKKGRDSWDLGLTDFGTISMIK